MDARKIKFLAQTVGLGNIESDSKIESCLEISESDGSARHHTRLKFSYSRTYSKYKSDPFKLGLTFKASAIFEWLEL